MSFFKIRTDLNGNPEAGVGIRFTINEEVIETTTDVNGVKEVERDWNNGWTATMIDTRYGVDGDNPVNEPAPSTVVFALIQ